MSTTVVGVVIPYFQRQPGLLTLALASIGNQSVLVSRSARIRVAIVDDSSPYPLSDELKDYVAPPGVELLTKLQANGGAGAARNAALELLQDSCDVIAFLDSDDTWSPDHLERALIAMDNGADFYFSDANRGEDCPSENADAPSWFTGSLQTISDLTDPLFSYSGNTDLVIVKGLVPTSSVIVHRWLPASTARFPSRYFRFGEDQYYCLKFLSLGGRIAYSPKVEVACGRGVNIFAGNVPGSESARLCLMDEIAYRNDALSTLALSREADSHIRSKLVDARQSALQQGLWFALDGQFSWIMRSIRRHPSLLMGLPGAAWFVLRTALRHRAASSKQI